MMLTTRNSTGFYCATISKLLLLLLCVSSIALNFTLQKYAKYFTYNPHELFQNHKNLFRLLLTRTIFVETKDLFSAAVLVYNFRVFERRYGSRKFFTFLTLVGIMSLLFEIFAVYLIDLCSIKLEKMPAGPFGLVFAFFVPFFSEIPRVTATHILGVPMTGKSLVYIIGLQMASSSSETLMLACCGLLAGMVYKNVGFFSTLNIPIFIGSTCESTLGKLFSSGPPSDHSSPLGATIQLQRAQQVERLEQQMLMAHMNATQGRPNIGFPMFNRNQPNAQNNPISTPTEEQITQLTDMGFSRERAEAALRRTENNTNMATALLLDESS